MIISLSWLRELVQTHASDKEIADKLSVSGLEVEHEYRWESVVGGLKGFVIGEVKACEKHPNADKLSITKVDIGTGELQPIVCGAPNVAAGQKVVVATPGTEVTVPGKGSFTIAEAKIRGEVSRGMICAEDEMGLGTSHDGILVLPNDAAVGTPAADYFKVASDNMLEIGLTANRGDAASHLGVARDVAALFGAKVTLPEVADGITSQSKFQIQVEDAGFCSRYVGVQISSIRICPSPDWMQNRLRSLGIEPKNIAVDATNYVLHELGQPLHAFDAEKIKGLDVAVRQAKPGEKLTTLDKADRALKGGELLITDGSEPIALAGVMGGKDTAVSDTTTTIFLESAHFHAGLVRKTARAHGLSTDASFRFERGTDVEICRVAALRAAELIVATAGGNIDSITDHYPEKARLVEIEFSAEKLNAFAGTDIPAVVVKQILESLGFALNGNNHEWRVGVPSWCHGMETAADLYEEVLRIYGYDNIPLSGKMKASMPAFKGIAGFKKQEQAARYLIANGCFEIMNNSLSSGGFYNDADTLVKLDNPLSSDMEYMRGSLLPGMLQAAAYNRNRKNHNIRFFEFGRVYQTANTGFLETQMLGLLLGGYRTAESWETKQQPMDFYYAKSLTQGLLQTLGVQPEASDAFVNILQPDKALMKKVDLEGEFWFVEINWELALKAASETKGLKVQTPPKFPYMRRDLSLVVDKNVKFSALQEIIDKQKAAILKKVNVFDVFEGKPLDEGKKAVAIAFYLGADESTLTDEIADQTMQQLMAAFEKNGAVIRR